jgi:hypothetical protein
MRACVLERCLWAASMSNGLPAQRCSLPTATHVFAVPLLGSQG